MTTSTETPDTPLDRRAAGLLDAISDFCRQNQMAESTFGRRAVNDGKFVSRLRDGARITPETLARVRAFMEKNGMIAPVAPPELKPLLRVDGRAEATSSMVQGEATAESGASGKGAPETNFRFFYLRLIWKKQWPLLN